MIQFWAELISFSGVDRRIIPEISELIQTLETIKFATLCCYWTKIPLRKFQLEIINAGGSFCRRKQFAEIKSEVNFGQWTLHPNGLFFHEERNKWLELQNWD